MDQETYRKIRAFVSRKLIKDLHDEIDDCTQHIAMRVFEGSKADWFHLLVDWLRENGHTDRGKISGQLIAQFSKSNLEVDLDFYGDSQSMDNLDTKRRSQEVESYFNVLSENEETVVRRHTCGDSLKEISEDIGFTESRASQLLSSGTNKMQRHAERMDFVNELARHIGGEDVRRWVFQNVKSVKVRK